MSTSYIQNLCFEPTTCIDKEVKCQGHRGQGHYQRKRSEVKVTEVKVKVIGQKIKVTVGHKKRSEIKVTKVKSKVMVLHVLCKRHQEQGKNCWQSGVAFSGMFFSVFNSMANPLVYTILMPSYRRAMVSTFCSCLTSQEPIESRTGSVATISSQVSA